MIVFDWCFLCKKDSESINYVFLYYEMVRSWWYDIIGWTCIDSVMPKEVVGLLTCWKGVKGDKRVANICKMIPLCLMWLERNNRWFENRECSIGNLRDFFFRALLFQAKALVLNGDNFLDLLQFIFFSVYQVSLLYTLCTWPLRNIGNKIFFSF